MRYLFGLMCVCALGVVPLVGCGEAAPECEVPADCPGDLCTVPGQEDCVGGVCTYEPVVCSDYNECTTDACDPAVGCGVAVADGTACAGGTCQAGVCELTGSVLPCSEQGIRNAIAAGGDEPYTFDCGGPTTVVVEHTIAIDNNVILDGEGNLTLDGNDEWVVFELLREDVTAELRGFTVTRGGVWNPNIEGWVGGSIDNVGTLTLTNTSVSDNIIGIENGGTLTLTNSTVSGNENAYGIGNNGALTLTNSTVSGNVTEDDTGIFIYGGTVTLLNSTVSDNIYVQTRDDDEPSRSATIVTAATLIDGACSQQGEVTWTSNGYNIESPGNTCGFDQPTDRPETTAAELNLGALADNGGPTLTHLPGGGDFGDGSVAIDKIPEADCGVTEDQRGEPRPVVIVRPEQCDVGSVEVQPEDL
ncbi:MAG: hypothetical protein JSW51_10410 [Gemmatimonadota bacterium]|nr:MAG: hypothetical protein JSW51_10410 [Gemmatimonadota bacterium]